MAMVYTDLIIGKLAVRAVQACSRIEHLREMHPEDREALRECQYDFMCYVEPLYEVCECMDGEERDTLEEALSECVSMVSEEAAKW